MFQYRQGTKSDAKNIAALHAENWRLNYRGILDDHYLDFEVEADRSKVWHDRLKRNRSDMRVIVVEKGAILAGFGCIFYNENPETYIGEITKIEGADWDRRNRLRVHQSLVKIQHRDFKGAAPVLLEGLATFNTEDLCTFESYTVYCILTNLLFLDRPTLKTKIMDGPEILAISKDIPIVVRGFFAWFLWNDSGGSCFGRSLLTYTPDEIGAKLLRL